MKKIFLLPPALLVAAVAWFGFNWVFLPAPPAIKAQKSPEVTFVFQIHQMGMTEVELALRGAGGGGSFFTHFTMSDGWANGRPGLELKSMGNSSSMRNGKKLEEYKKEAPADPNKGFTKFTKDNNGKDVTTYVFKQSLAEGEDGKLYLKMEYGGPKMPLIQSLKISKPMKVPDHVSKRFTKDGLIQFNAGTVYLDKKINGFWIPVTII